MISSEKIVRSENRVDARWVLIAEDDDDIRLLIREAIVTQAQVSQCEVEIVEAKDGAEALQKATLRQFHCVVTDLRMPNSTGEQFIRSLQTHPLNAATPMLVVSGYAREEFREFCDRYSHIKVIPKPFEPSALASTVIREIKLGRLDDRISIHLMNPFVTALTKFMTEELKIEFNLSQPAVKKPGDAIAGEYHCTMMLATPVTRARFTFSFSRQLLDFAKATYYLPKAAQWTSLAPDDIARLMIQSILERASEAVKICMGDTARLAGLSIVTKKQEQLFEELMDSNGVVVVSRSDYGPIVAGALSRSKQARF